jgi:hypothetical protein
VSWNKIVGIVTRQWAGCSRNFGLVHGWSKRFVLQSVQTKCSVHTASCSEATKCSDHHTISLTGHTAKIIAKILKGRMKGKSRIYLEKICLDLEEEKELGMQLG